jgi:hypothetical protein
MKLFHKILQPIITNVMRSNHDQGEATTWCGKVCQWLSTGRWFSLGSPVSSTNKTDHQDITEILLKVALNTNKQTNKQYELTKGGTTKCYNNGDIQLIKTWYYSHFIVKIIRQIRHVQVFGQGNEELHLIIICIYI